MQFDDSDIAPFSSKELFDIQTTIECKFTLKRVRDMIMTYRPRFDLSFLLRRKY